MLCRFAPPPFFGGTAPADKATIRRGFFFEGHMEKERKGAAPPEKPVNIKAVCEYMGAKETYIYEQCNRGTIPFHQIGGRKFFFLSEIEEAIKRA